jgi:hypothetical protein
MTARARISDAYPDRPRAQEPPRRVTLTADLRRAVADWLAQGYAVDIRPDGSLRVEPARGKPDADDFDMVDMRR